MRSPEEHRDVTHFANTVVRWDQLCAAILRRNGRVELSFLVYAISKNALESVYLGSLQPPTDAVSLSASAGPQLAGLYGITLESSRIGSTMRHASST
jgi:hypothetical protein